MCGDVAGNSVSTCSAHTNLYGQCCNSTSLKSVLLSVLTRPWHCSLQGGTGILAVTSDDGMCIPMLPNIINMPQGAIAL